MKSLNTGSVEGGTGWYLVVLVQIRAVLVASMLSFQKIYCLHGLNYQIIEYSKKGSSKNCSYYFTHLQFRIQKNLNRTKSVSLQMYKLESESMRSLSVSERVMSLVWPLCQVISPQCDTLSGWGEIVPSKRHKCIQLCGNKSGQPGGSDWWDNFQHLDIFIKNCGN